MKIKNISVGIAGIFLFVAAGLPQTAVADRAIKMDLRFAGAFATGIAHEFPPASGELVPSALIHATAEGKPGKAEIRGYGGTTVFAGIVADCLGIAGAVRLEVTDNPLVFTFKKLALLYAKGGSGEICIDLTTGVQKFVILIDFMGGTGKFEGATGTAVITGEGVPVSADATFLAETGTLVGTIFVPKKKK